MEHQHFSLSFLRRHQLLTVNQENRELENISQHKSRNSIAYYSDNTQYLTHKKIAFLGPKKGKEEGVSIHMPAISIL